MEKVTYFCKGEIQFVVENSKDIDIWKYVEEIEKQFSNIKLSLKQDSEGWTRKMVEELK